MEEPLYVSWNKNNPQERARALATSAYAAHASEPVFRACGYNTFTNIVPDVTVRDGYNRGDYEWFRPGDTKPRTKKEIIRVCNDAYKNIGIVKNIIDIMGDFTAKGISVEHPNDKVEEFGKQWFKKINGAERAERFANLLYRVGNVIVKRTTAKVTRKRAKDLERGFGSPDMRAAPIQEVDKLEIPWKYTLLNPLDIDVVGEEMATFAGNYSYVLKIPDALSRRIRFAAQTPEDAALISSLPEEITNLIKKGD